MWGCTGKPNLASSPALAMSFRIAEAASGGHQLLDLGRYEVLPGAAVAVPGAPGRGNFPVYGAWRRFANGSQVRVPDHAGLPDIPYLGHFKESIFGLAMESSNTCSRR